MEDRTWGCSMCWQVGLDGESESVSDSISAAAPQGRERGGEHTVPAPSGEACLPSSCHQRMGQRAMGVRESPRFSALVASEAEGGLSPIPPQLHLISGTGAWLCYVFAVPRKHGVKLSPGNTKG